MEDANHVHFLGVGDGNDSKLFFLTLRYVGVGTAVERRRRWSLYRRYFYGRRAELSSS